jgi:hypothetical protein
VRRWGAERRLPAGAGTAHLLPREPRCPGRGAQQWVGREAKVRGGRCAVKRARSARALSPRWAAAGGSTGGEWLGERPPVAEGGPPEERREGTHTSRGTHGCKCSAGGTVANLQTLTCQVVAGFMPCGTKSPLGGRDPGRGAVPAHFVREKSRIPSHHGVF